MIEEILKRIPQRDPFLYIENIIDVTSDSVTASKLITGKEDFFKGHFPGNPIMPGVLLCEAAFQTGALLMSYIMPNGLEGKTAVVSRIKGAKFKNLVRPEDEIIVNAKLDEQIDNAAYINAKITVKDKTVLQISFACTLIG